MSCSIVGVRGFVRFFCIIVYIIYEYTEVFRSFLEEGLGMFWINRIFRETLCFVSFIFEFLMTGFCF